MPWAHQRWSVCSLVTLLHLVVSQAKEKSLLEGRQKSQTAELATMEARLKEKAAEADGLKKALEVRAHC